MAEDKVIDIQRFLPHREPMLMVDEILDITAKHVICSFIIKETNVFLHEGKFQEVGLVENMAQVCSSIVGQNYYDIDYNPEKDQRAIGFISGIKSLRIILLPNTGDVLFTEARLTSQYDGDDYSVCTMQIQTKVLDLLCAEAQINLFLQRK